MMQYRKKELNASLSELFYDSGFLPTPRNREKLRALICSCMKQSIVSEECGKIQNATQQFVKFTVNYCWALKVEIGCLL